MRVLALLVAGLLLAGCTGEPDAGTRNDSAPVSVDVDTPALRAQRAAADLEPCRAPRTTTAVAGGLPDLTLPCLGGGPSVPLQGLRGPLVINLFAQWCGPCRTELPYYQQLHRAGAGRVRVIGVDYLDTQPGRAIALARRSGVTYPLLADPGSRLRGPLGVRGLPGVAFVDARGRVSRVEFRLISSYDELRDLVRQRLGVALPAR